jgi:predicted HicB family RNase H-like nuclease
MLTAETAGPSSRSMVRPTKKISETALLIRMSKKLRREATRAAAAQGMNLSEWIRGAMRTRLEQENPSVV